MSIPIPIDSPIVRRALTTQKDQILRKIREHLKDFDEGFPSIQTINTHISELRDLCKEYNGVLELLDPTERESRIVKF